MKKRQIINSLCCGLAGCFFTSLIVVRPPFTEYWLAIFVAGYVIELLLLALAWAIVLAVRAIRRKRAMRMSYFD